MINLDALLSAIQERKRLAEALREFAWYSADDLRTLYGLGMSISAFIAAVSPAEVLRQVERDERVLLRHTPYFDDETRCSTCSGCGQFEPCDDKIDLAHAYAIPTEDGDDADS